MTRFCTAAMAEHAAGAAKRRRERRLRQWQRHERMTVAMALAEATHHAAPRRQTPVSAIREEVENETHAGLRAQKSPPPGVRAGILPEPGLQRSDRTVRRFAGPPSRPLACPPYWLGRWERQWTPPLSASSQPLRWRT